MLLVSVPGNQVAPKCGLESMAAGRLHIESFAMKVTLLTRETPNAKTLTNEGISFEAALVRRCHGLSTVVFEIQKRGSVSQVESRQTLSRE